MTMNKILITILLAVSSFSLKAQDFMDGFHTFIDLYAGFPSGSFSGEYSDDSGYYAKNIKPTFSFGMNITEGYQVLPNLFAGIGFGAYAPVIYHKDGYNGPDYQYAYTEHNINSIYFPFSADVRWTLKPEATITPYADIKIGYQAGIDFEDSELLWEGTKNYEKAHINGVYFVPSIGVRFGRAAGFNLGIAYNTSMRAKIIETYSNGQEPKTIEKKNFGVFMLTIGADF